MNTNLTASQKDFAIFTPALSTFFSTYVGKQQVEEYVEKSRIPNGFFNGVEGMNYLNAALGYFQYKWSLYSAGHANIDITANDPKERMITRRDRQNSFILTDSGGFQIAGGKWPADWSNPNCPIAQKKRSQVLSWMDTNADYSITLDIPAWVCRNEEGKKNTGITSYAGALAATKINNDYFINNRNGNCKFLNVLQGENHTEADSWYDEVKDYCNPSKYPGHFNGYAFGGQNRADPHLILRRLMYLKWEGLLEPGIHDWIHFLGTSKLEFSVMFTDLQRAIRRNHNPNLTISYDCASPFLATANGQVYYEISLKDRGKWSYKMGPSADDKKYSTDNRSFRDAVLQDKIYKHFEETPISSKLKISDICYYAKGDLNKNGKEGKTSWDSFAYTLLMSHNVYLHISAVQRANEMYDQGFIPKMLVEESHQIIKWRDIVNKAFEAKSLTSALAIIDKYDKFYLQIMGPSGHIGKKTFNATTQFNKFFK